MLKKIICFILFVALVINGVAGVNVNESNTKNTNWEILKGEDFVSAVNNDNFELSVNPSNGFFKLFNRQNNQIIYSNPLDYKNDNYAKGINRAGLSAQLIINCIDKKGQLFDVFSSTNSAFDNDLTVQKSENSLKYTFKFSEYKLSVAMIITLDKDKLKVSIPLDNNIVENDANKIVSIQVLPYFNAGSINENGFILVPDGIGGIINFNNNKQQAMFGYSEAVYGEDKSIFNDIKPVNKEKITMPVFGISKEEGMGSFAIITSGASLSKINANVSKGISSYNNVFASFQIRGYEEVTTLNRTWAAKKYTLSSKNRETKKALSIDYKVFSQNNTSILDMSKYYREYLISNGLEKNVQNNYTLYLDLYMGVKKNKQFLGIVYNGYENLTTFNEAKQISKTYLDNKVDCLVIRTKGASADGAYGGNINDKFRIQNSIGGEKGYIDLQNYLNEHNSKLFNQVELLEFTTSSFGYNTSFDNALSVTQKPIKIYQYRLSTLERRFDIIPKFLLKPNKIQIAASSLAKSLENSSVEGVAPSSISCSPYSVYNSGQFISREETLDYFINSINELKKTSGILLENPVIDFVKSSNQIVCMPTGGSMINIIDDSIPFLYFVIHGLVSYSCEPINLKSNINKQVLNAIECGASPMFSFIYEDYEKIMDTPLEYLYGAKINVWMEKSIDIYNKMKSAVGDLTSMYIIGYEIINENVKIITYSNNTKIIINYSENSYFYENNEVKPIDFIKIN